VSILWIVHGNFTLLTESAGCSVAWPCFTIVLQELLEEFAFNIAHFTELMAILWGSLPLGGMANRQRQSTSINHNWPPVGIVASCSYLRFQFGSLCHFLSKISLIRAITYATIRTWYLCTRSTISFTYWLLKKLKCSYTTTTTTTTTTTKNPPTPLNKIT
jgi:hypothetical protein